MQKKLLVTTALQNTWGKKNKITFLGDWCEKYDNFKNLDHSFILEIGTIKNKPNNTTKDINTGILT